MQSTKLFRKYLEDTIESLQKSYDNYKTEEAQATDKHHQDILNGSAAQIFEGLAAMRHALQRYNTTCQEKPEFQILEYNFYESIPSNLKLKYKSGDIITISIARTSKLPSNEVLDILLERAYDLAEQFNQVDEVLAAEA